MVVPDTVGNHAGDVAAVVYTVGHSNHPLEAFLALLARHRITAIGDVRSDPYSRRNPQFNREPLRDALAQAGIAYVFLGDELGARTRDPDCYEHGKVSYERLARTDAFRHGLERVERGAAEYRLALMCAEKEPLDCHRTILVARHLHERGGAVRHILASGELEAHEQTVERLKVRLGLGEDLFRAPDEVAREAFEVQGRRMGYAEEGQMRGDRTP
jgi:uncharacterized protein (DUF488 family)